MSRFLPLSHYQETLSTGYSLTPVRFTRLRGSQYVLTNQVGEHIVIDRDDLQRFVNHELDPRSALYNNLKSKHLLVDADSSVGLDLLALKQRTKLHRLSDFTSLHMIVVTLRCDHSCHYCQVSRQSADKLAFDMSSETARATVDLVFRSPSPAIKIEFQGGESLLNFDLIREIVELAEAKNLSEKRDLAFVVATNLSPLTDAILEFCSRHNILISTSLDGPEDLHNQNRPRPGKNSHALAVSGIKRAQEHLGRERVSALMTTTKSSLERARDIVDEYVALELPGIFLRPLSPYGFAIKTRAYSAYDTDRWLDFYKEGLSYIIDINRSGHFFPEHYASMILTKMLSPFETGYVDQMSPSGIGIAAVIYNYDGNVYASDESRMRAEMGDYTFRLGNVHTDTYEQLFKSDALLDPLETSFANSVPMCSECAFEPFCGADPVYHHVTQGDFVGRKPTSGFCRRNMEISRHLICLLQEDEDTRRILRSWVTA
jgi:His-Xaa-Ser system radical SAM maturase HxsB